MKKKPAQVHAAKLPGKPLIPVFYQRLLLILICAACYGNTVLNKYSLDDDFAVFKNPYIQKGVAGIPDILTKPYVTTDTKQMDYRPVAGVLFAIEHQFFGNNPHISHLVNTLLFLLLTLVIFWVLNEVFRLEQLHPLLPFVITLLYVVHPSHTEAVASIKNRDEILSFLFALLAFIFSHRFLSTSGNKRVWMAAFAIILMLLSVLSKIVSLPVLGVIFLYGYFHGLKHGHNRPFYIFFASLFIIAFGVVVAITSSVKREMYNMENPLVDYTDFSHNAGTILETLFFYFKFMLWPYPPRFFYGFNVIPVIPLSDPLATFSFLLHIAVLIGGIVLFLRKQLAGFFILGYLLNIAFYSNIIRYPGIVSERILFIPSLWFLAALVLVIFHLAKFGEVKKSLGVFQKAILMFGVLVMVAYATLTIRRNAQWKDRLTLLESDMPHLKKSGLANFWYAEALMGERLYVGSHELSSAYLDSAVVHYKRTLQVADEYSPAYFELGIIFDTELSYFNRNSAFHYFFNAHKFDTRKTTDTKYHLGRQYYYKEAENEAEKKENYTEAERLFNQVYQAWPEDTFTLYFYTSILHFQGKIDSASLIKNQLLELAPNFYQNNFPVESNNNQTKFQLAEEYLFKKTNSDTERKENYARAEQLFSELYQEVPNDTLVLYYYARALYFQGKTDKALEIKNNAAKNYDKALRLGLRDQRIYDWLFNHYSATGQNQKIEELQKFY